MKKTRTPSTRNKFEARLLKEISHSPYNVCYESERIPYVIAGHYIPDFIVETPTGKLYIEAKGHFRPEAKRKMVAVKKQHPELDIRMVFYSKNKTYIRWCERHGFKYAISSIPEEWYLGL